MKQWIKLLVLFFSFGGFMLGASFKTITINEQKIPVIFEKSSIIPTGNIQLIFSRSGSAYDNGVLGLASLSASLLNEGTKELGATGFADLLEQRAITLYASSSQEFLELTLSFLKEEQDEALNLLDQLIKSPNLTQETLEKIKTRAKSKLLAKDSDFDYVASLGLSELLFKDTPLQYPSLGTSQSIQNITLEQIQYYLQNALSLSRLHIIVGGDLETDVILERLTHMLSSLPIGKKPELQFYEANANQQVKTQSKQTQQAYIYFGSPFNLKSYREEAYKVKVMAFILGSSGFGSRMMEEIRVKKGLAYSAYMKINLTTLTNYASGYLQTKIENQDKSIALVKEVIENFIANGVTQEELDSAKQFLLGSEPLRNETLDQRLNTAFANYYRGLNLDYNQDELKKIRALTLQDLNTFIKSHTEILKLSFSIVTK